VRKIAIAVLLLTLAMLCAGCVRIVMPPSPDGENNGGYVEMISEQEALNIAEATITTDFPDMVDAEKMSQSYSSKGREFYEFTYKKINQVETDTGTLEIPQIVIVTIDKSTGEKFIAVSD
jgi:hypothetical protein